MLCHDPAVVLRIRAANVRAYAILKTAEGLVAARGPAAQIEAAIGLANAAIADFAAMVPGGTSGG